MNDHRHLKTWNIYQSAWAPIGEAERRDLLAQSVADDIFYTDLVSQAHGVNALADRIAKSQEQFAGSRFRNDSFLDHHDQELFQWTMLNAARADAVKATSFARFGDGGRIVQAAGFFQARSG